MVILFWSCVARGYSVNEPKKSIAEPQDPTGYETHEDEDDDESE